MILITTPDGLTHKVESAEEIAGISSPNTRAALQAAYDAGDWQPYEPPTPEPAPVETDAKGFKMALMGDPLFLQWQLDLPPIQREDMKLAAIADNWPLAQQIYSQLKAAIAQPPDGPAQWQALADAHGIPLEF
ncbi:MAG TPA: hypothetical protein VLO13_05615 [Halomonas sp.]|nr:hypothetical protein [Halomonas sp.]